MELLMRKFSIKTAISTALFIFNYRNRNNSSDSNQSNCFIFLQQNFWNCSAVNIFYSVELYRTYFIE